MDEAEQGKPNWDRVKQIFHEAREVTGPERERRLAVLCGDNAVLRAQVLLLLQADEASPEFLDSPTVDEADAAARAAAALAESGPPEGPGSHIGSYKLLQKIGEGGFGIVYMAEQEEPVRRRVALKVIKPGMDTKQVIARFESERQALAMLDHPNIAKVFDAGTTPAGRPYFVMELVKGIPITDYCDEERLSTRERLELFTGVCSAVHHAHENGIIHRDIKPSNILVTLHDGTPVPKVIDFGVAKAIRQKLTEATLFTEYNQFIGTPEYMAPEQALYAGLEVDRRSDVYSLGALLYELLTGVTPFEARELRRAAQLEVLRILKEEEPLKPSTRVHTLGESSGEAAVQRRTDAERLEKLLRGDLDCIVMKALEKDRKRRYESAADMAADITRYFEQRPIVARPPSAIYRIQKLVRRRRGRFAAAAVVALALLGSSAYVKWHEARLIASGVAWGGTPGDSSAAHTLAVMPFSFRGASKLSHLSDGLREAMSASVASRGRLHSVDPHLVLASQGEAAAAASPDEARATAEKLGAGLYLLGSVVSVGDRVGITASLYDRSRGPRPVAQRYVEGSVREFLSLVEALGRQLTDGADGGERTALSVRLLWSGADVSTDGSLSPDGRYLSMMDDSTYGLAVKDLRTGQVRRVLIPHDTTRFTDGWVLWSQFSPGGDQIAYIFNTTANDFELRVCNRDGSGDRLLFHDLKGYIFAPVWLPEGDEILLSTGDSHVDGLIRVRVRDSRVDTLHGLGKASLVPSPDGAWLASTVEAADGRNSDMVLYARADGRRVTIAQAPGLDNPLIWTPDSRHLLFWSNRGSAPGLWEVGIEDGRAGEPRLLRRNMWLPKALGFAADDFYYGIRVGDAELFTAPLDSASGELAGDPEPVRLPGLFVRRGRWSPDGLRYAFEARPVETGRSMYRNRLGIREEPSGSYRILDLPGLNGIHWPSWGRDGTSVLVTSSNEAQGPGGLFRFRPATGELERIFSDTIANWLLPRELPDGRIVTSVMRSLSDIPVVLRDVVNRTEEDFYSLGALDIAVSPDGRLVALCTGVPEDELDKEHPEAWPMRVVVKPSAGGPIRDVATIEGRVTAVAWAPDGRSLYYTATDAGSKGMALHNVRLDGSDDRVLYRALNLNDLDVRPDGRRISFRSGQAVSEVWVIENITKMLQESGS